MPAARRRAASCRRSGMSGLVGAIFLLAVILALQDVPDTMAEGLAGGFPIADDHHRATSPTELVGGITVGEIYLFVILVVGLRLHARDPGRRDADDVLDGSRPAPAARPALGPRQPDVPDAGQRGGRGRRPRRDPDPGRSGRSAAIYALDRRDRAHLPELLPVQHRRRSSPGARGWPRQEGLVQPRALGHARSTSWRSSGAA